MAQRLGRILGHINPSSLDEKKQLQQQPTSDATLDWSNRLKHTGWGYKDTKFTLNHQGLVSLSGSRYLFSGKALPSLRSWMEESAGLNIDDASPPQPQGPVPAAIRNEDFLAQIEGNYAKMSFSDRERLFHGHGHTTQELFKLRYGKFDRVPDVVIWPGSSEHVEVIVKAAHANNVVIIPYGGGTNVTQALMCPENENRMIVSLDMHKMCRIKWFDRTSMMACVEAGAVGKELEEKFANMGYCLGHEPDSLEFSTLGGWISTRASGMRKNRYGNIEDIVRRIKLVTPVGVVEKSVKAPRQSTGPDIHHFVMGSEGTLGVITEAVLRVHKKPAVIAYGSLIFPDFESGVACMHEVAMKKAAPVSIRLVDNMQFQFGQALKPEVESVSKFLTDKVKKWYVLNRLGFEPEKMTAATMLFEGDSASEISATESKVYAIAAKYGGVKAGEENGIRGYFLTYMIAYLRDFGLDYSFCGDSFETSVPWGNVMSVCTNVKETIRRICLECKVKAPPFISCRVTQTYDTGACIYFYFGFLWTGLADPLAVFEAVEDGAREEILALGGSLSHHHGIGKLRKKWLPSTISETGIAMLKGVKNAVDPKNIFANGNLVSV